MLICELEAIGASHAEFNAAVIALARATFPVEPVCFLAPGRHCAAVESELARHHVGNVTFVTLAEPPKGGNGHADRLYRARTVRSVYRLCRKLGCSRILICGFNGWYHNYFSLLMPRRFRGRYLGLIHCGDYLLSAKNAPWRSSPKARVIRFLTRSRERRLIVLGPTVAQHIKANLAYSDVEIDWMYHPYLFGDAGDQRRFDPNRLNFVFLGRSAKEKRFDVFCRIAEEVLGDLPSPLPNVAFTLIGGLRWMPNEYSEGGAVRVADSAHRLTREAFASHLNEASYVVMPYDSDRYGKTKVSGVFFDAVKHLKPIIALNTDDLRHYFEMFGDLGILCDSVDEMRRAILDVVRDPPSKAYAEQQGRLREARDFFHRERQTRAFEALWR